MDAETINRKIHEWLGKSWYEVKLGGIGFATCPRCLPTAPPEDAKALEDAKAFKRVAIELRIRFPVEIQYNSEFEAIVKRLEGGSL